MAFTLRDYQQKGKDMISREFQKGNNRVGLWAQTGSGKGLWMADFVREALGKKMPTLSVMRRREIIFQTINNYNKYFSIESNAIMGNIKNNNQHGSTVASIDTLRNRIITSRYEHLKEIPFVVIDECHDLTSSTYKRLIWFLENYNLSDFSDDNFENEKDCFKKIYLGLSATFFRVGRRTHTFWQSVVKPIEAHELRDMGYLVPVRIKAPRKIDMTGVRIDAMTGDFNQKETFERVSKLQVIGDVVETYREYGENKPAICFCVNQAHSKIMVQAFRAAGIPAIHCDADHSQAERDAAVKGLKDGKYKVLCNCNIFSTGFDAPWVEVEISARPSDSENLTLQQWGRVLRPYKVCANCSTEYGGDPSCYRCGSTLTSYVKKDALILDHANNTDRWGLPYDVREAELETIDTTRKRSHMGIGVKTCPKCHAVLHNSDRYCICNYDFAENRGGMEMVEHIEGEMHDVDEKFLKDKLYQRIKQKYNTYKRLEMLKEWGPNAKYHKLYEDFDEQLFEHSAAFGITLGLKKMLQENRLNQGIKGFMDNTILENKKVINN